ncbi:MAG: type IV secretory system conjugative DNA transfer family protein [Proteobacteria bacterium]|nr:type IV secretory system conjugative DNA transfer family protein [Pseudomonadota bacterium]
MQKAVIKANAMINDEAKKHLIALGVVLLFTAIALIAINLIYLYNLYQIHYGNVFTIRYFYGSPLDTLTYWALAILVIGYVLSYVMGLLGFTYWRKYYWLGMVTYLVVMLIFFVGYIYNEPVQTYAMTTFGRYQYVLRNNTVFWLLHLFLVLGVIIDAYLIYSGNKSTNENKANQTKNSNIIKALSLIKYVVPFILAGYVFVYGVSLLSSAKGLANPVALSALVAVLVLLACLPICLHKKRVTIFSAIMAAILAGFCASGLVYSLISHLALSISPFSFLYYLADSQFQLTVNMKFAVIAGIFVFAVLMVAIVRVLFYLKKNKLHGNARWATLFDLMRYKMLNQGDASLSMGKWQGRNIWLNGFAPVLVLANVGGGKSTAFAIPNIINWDGSTVNNDTSNELYEATSNYLRSRGESVYQFCPLSRKTHCFNPFHWACSMDKADRWGVIERICKKIIPTSKNDHAQSWSSMARRVLEGLTDYLISTTGYCTLGQLAEICCKGNFNEWLRQEILTNDQVEAQFKVNANAFLNIEAEQTQGGVKFNYEAYIGLYLNPIIRAATEYSDIDITKLRQEKMHIFFGIPDGEIKQLEPLITIFWEEISAHLMKKVPNVESEPYPVLFNIDEFGNSGRLDRIRKNLTTFRKYRVRSIVYLQYKDQVAQDFTLDEARAFNSIPNKILLSATGSIDDAKYLSELFGQRTIKYKTKNRQSMRMEVNSNEHLQQKPLITSDELMHLEDDQGLAHISGKHGIKFKKSYYFKDRKLSKLLGEKINPDLDKHVPVQTPIEPVIDLSLMKREMTEEEKAAKKLERDEKAQLKHEREMEKIREMTSMVLASVKQSTQSISDLEKMEFKDVENKDI